MQPSRPLPEHPTASSAMLEAARQMDPQQWSRLANTFGPIVYRWCRSSGIPEADCPDLVQNVFVSVAKGIGRFQRQKVDGSFRSWLATITRNQVRDYFRCQARQPNLTGGSEALHHVEALEESLDSTICAGDVQQSIVARQLEMIRGDFEPATWSAFWLTVVEGKSTQHAASETGLSAASVYQAKSRILRRLRGEMSGLPE